MTVHNTHTHTHTLLKDGMKYGQNETKTNMLGRERRREGGGREGLGGGGRRSEGVVEMETMDAIHNTAMYNHMITG